MNYFIKLEIFEDVSINYYNQIDKFNFNYTSSSPAIDFGTSTDAPAYDLRGVSRPQGSGYDAGAYEY